MSTSQYARNNMQVKPEKKFLHKMSSFNINMIYMEAILLANSNIDQLRLTVQVFVQKG